MNRYFLLAVIFSLAFQFSLGQSDTTKAKSLPTIEINALRINTPDQRTPFSVSRIDQQAIQQGNQQLSINESLVAVPGLFALNADNFAQDLRVSIRGFGARAAFGIRGVKLLVDGIPESTPDGQAQVDNVDMGLIQNMQILRGPAAGIYGNAAGGVILLQTEDVKKPFVEARISAGSYNFQKYQAKAGFRYGKFSGLIYGSHTQTDGYRSHSEMESTLLNGRFRYEWDSLTSLTLFANYVNSPLANDPGGVDSTAFTDNPRDARQRNVDFDGGESVEQGRIALNFQKGISDNQRLNIRAYHLSRDFDNRLPFGFGGAVSIDRTYTGGGIAYTYTGSLGEKAYRLQTGADLDYQADDRTRFFNNEGEIGDLTFDQLESFFSFGAYVYQELYLSPQFNLNLSLRFDALNLEAEDRFLGNGDDSGKLDFQQFNPMFGILYAPNQHISLFANVSSSFETPTLSELSANPDGGGGFNPDLAPQKARNIEIGIKGSESKIQYSLSLYYIRVFDELVPFELPAFPDREFFRNAGSSNRLGAEVFLQAELTKGLNAMASVSLNEFSYRDYQVNEDIFDENKLPGIPAQTGYIALSYQHPSGFYAKSWLQTVGSIYTNDRNSVKLDPYSLLNARVAWTFKSSWGEIEPFFGVNNIFDKLYPGNVRINAFGGRFYEAGAGAHVFAGIRARVE
ncbi:MAG: TonB-dependent receptor [Bacteroidia bacterium]|nr:TonB-dependent receptor [Bacteroidia bacterium]